MPTYPSSERLESSHRQNEDDPSRFRGLISEYATASRLVLLAPWSGRCWTLEATAPRLLALVLVFHIGLAACIATLSSSWTYLAGVGLVRGVSQMTVGGSQLPVVSPGQVAAGLTLSVGIWSVLLLAVFGAGVVVADLAYFRDREGFRAAVRRLMWSTGWFVIWAGLTLVMNLERGGVFAHPARWPTGSTDEARSRLLSLLVLFPILWAAGVKPPGRDTRVTRRGILVVIYSVFYWLFWAGIWRAAPWISIEAYTG